jgi:hypothetical protein
VFLAITYFWKISFHAAVYAGGVMMVAGLLGWKWLALEMFLPLIIWARLKRHRHSVWQAIGAVAIITASVLVSLFFLFFLGEL